MKKAIFITLAVLAAGTGLIISGLKEKPQAAARGQAFLQAMAAHHESGVAMAEIAKNRSAIPEIKQLSNNIATTQASEIDQMRSIHRRLYRSSLQPDQAAHDKLGLSATDAGMVHGHETIENLRIIESFDQAFIAEMVPHHEGAIRMARAVLGVTQDPELRSLAEKIVSAQQQEITIMTAAYSKAYGTALPSSAPATEESNGHGGM